MKTIGLACDHAGFELKEYVRGWLEVKGWAYIRSPHKYEAKAPHPG